MSLIKSVLGWIRDDSGPNTVKEVNAADYAKFPIHLREENLMVYGPQKGLYEIAVLRPPNSSSSTQVFRSVSGSLAPCLSRLNHRPMESLQL